MNPLGFNNPDRCPLCGAANECQLCSTAAHKGPCWCASVEIPEALLARGPPDLKNKTSICRSGIAAFHAGPPRAAAQQILSGDFYFDTGGLVVFTAAYHQRRGYCCDSGCRHCPYG